MKHIRELEDENNQLMRIVASLSLGIEMLQNIVVAVGQPPCVPRTGSIPKVLTVQVQPQRQGRFEGADHARLRGACALRSY